MQGNNRSVVVGYQRITDTYGRQPQEQYVTYQIC